MCRRQIEESRDQKVAKTEWRHAPPSPPPPIAHTSGSPGTQFNLYAYNALAKRFGTVSLL